MHLFWVPAYGLEFRIFIEHTEAELRCLFNSIDKDHNGHLDRAELHAAFKNADITANVNKLDTFFDHIDTNHDGQITFEEWRYASLEDRVII